MASPVATGYRGGMTDPASLPNFPPPSDSHPLRGRVIDALQDLKLAPNIDSDGDVAFTVEDQDLFVRCTEGEMTVMRTFGQWGVVEPIPDDPLHQLRVCNEVNLSMNLVKTGLADKALVVTMDHLVEQNDDISVLLQISIQGILASVHMWHQRMLGLDPEQSADTDD